MTNVYGETQALSIFCLVQEVIPVLCHWKSLEIIHMGKKFFRLFGLFGLFVLFVLVVLLCLFGSFFSSLFGSLFEFVSKYVSEDIT